MLILDDFSFQTNPIHTPISIVYFSHSLLPIVVKFLIDVLGTKVERGTWEMFSPPIEKGRL